MLDREREREEGGEGRDGGCVQYTFVYVGTSRRTHKKLLAVSPQERQDRNLSFHWGMKADSLNRPGLRPCLVPSNHFPSLSLFPSLEKWASRVSATPSEML